MPPKRKLEKSTKQTISGIQRTYILIRKTEIKTLQGIFILAFIAGVFSALILAASVGMHQTSIAQSIQPTPKANECKIFPEGGTHGPDTVVMIKCGNLVREANYQWEGDRITKISHPGFPISTGMDNPSYLNAECQ